MKRNQCKTQHRILIFELCCWKPTECLVLDEEGATEMQMKWIAPIARACIVKMMKEK